MERCILVENIEIECSDCNAIYYMKHNLNKSRYDISFCSFCGGEDIEMEEDYEEEEDYY